MLHLWTILKAVVSPLTKIGLSMLAPLATDQMAKQATYRFLKSKAEQYRSRAYATKDLEDDKSAEFYMGIVKDLKSRWEIQE